jgi:hypothetical protein
MRLSDAGRDLCDEQHGAVEANHAALDDLAGSSICLMPGRAGNRDVPCCHIVQTCWPRRRIVAGSCLMVARSRLKVFGTWLCGTRHLQSGDT